MKPALALAVSGGLTQATRPEVDLDGLLAPARQLTMKSGYGLSESQGAAASGEGTHADAETADALSLAYLQEIMSELELTQAAPCTADVQPSLAQHSAESRLHSLLTIGDRTGSIAEHLSNLTSQMPETARTAIKYWMRKKMKPGMVKLLEPMVANKTLMDRMETLRSMTTDEDSSPEALLKEVNEHIRKLNEGATRSDNHIKLDFVPPLVLHLGDGSETDALESMKLNAADLTAGIYSNIFEKYRQSLLNIKEDQAGWFSKELAKDKMDFYDKYAKACFEDGNFRAHHVWDIQKQLGYRKWEMFKASVVVKYAMDVMREDASAYASKTTKQLSKSETAEEAKNLQSFAKQMSDGKNPFELLLNRAHELQHKEDDEKRSMLNAFIEDLPLGFGWLLSRSSFEANMKSIIADFARYMGNVTNKAEVRGGVSLLDASTEDLPLAPDQLRMLSCATSKVASALLFVRKPSDYKNGASWGDGDASWTMFCVDCDCEVGDISCDC